MRQIRIHPVLATLAALSIAFVSATPALAQKAKSTQNEATWVGYDEAAKTVTLEIKNNGRGPNSKMIKRGQTVTFNVKPTGSVLTRTSVAINGMKGELTDISEGKSVLIYWVPEKDKKGEFFARKIDVVLSEEELNRRYPDQE